jgi:hypothetical protein
MHTIVAWSASADGNQIGTPVLIARPKRQSIERGLFVLGYLIEDCVSATSNLL